MRTFVLAATSLCFSLAAAQSAVDADAKERMERARRDASNPLRAIIEASQVKRGKESAAVAAAAGRRRRPPRGPRPCCRRGRRWSNAARAGARRTRRNGTAASSRCGRADTSERARFGAGRRNDER